MRRSSQIFLLLMVFGLTLAGLSLVSAQDSSYTVEYGDVLDVIAAGFNVSASCIAEASGLENPNQLRPGDSLVIPANCPPYDGLALGSRPAADTEDNGQGGGSTQRTTGSGNSYVVERGDVLDLIGAAFNVSAACIAETNGLDQPNRIFPGDELVIDTSCPPYDGAAFVNQEVASGQGGGTTRTGGGQTYVVSAGDVLDLIGAAYNVSPACIAETNELENANRIFPGDELVISATCPPYDGLATNGVLRSQTQSGGGSTNPTPRPTVSSVTATPQAPPPTPQPTPTPEAEATDETGAVG